MEPVLRDISDTARWVAIFRAEESERPDFVFCDPFARRLAGERGRQRHRVQPGQQTVGRCALEVVLKTDALILESTNR